MIEVPFTEYRLPDGRRKQYTVQIPASLADKFEDLTKHNCRLVGERLTNGLVSLSIEHDLGDVLLELSLPGPPAVEALHKLIDRWDSALFEMWLEGVHKEG